MPAREEILRELGLAPVWRLRGTATATTSTETEVASPMPTAASTEIDTAPRAPAAHPGGFPEGIPPVVVPLRPGTQTIDVEARRSRIAALEWPDLAADIDACNACGLCRTRNRSVPGVGDARAEWMFVGEAPGADEDARGEPFVGQAGRLLDSMLAALGMSRQRNVYIANVLKCRPPGNRTPEPAEAESCRPYLERQIALVGPRLVIALGRSAASLLLGTDASIASLRGRVHRYDGRPLIVTYHPAYLLRTLHDKAKAWEDLVFAKRTMVKLRNGEPL